MENIQFPPITIQSNQSNRKVHDNLKPTNIYAEKSEPPMFDFKVKIIHTDLMSSDGFHSHFHNAHNSSTAFMSQYSGYIAKLSQLNNFEGGTLSTDDNNDSNVRKNRKKYSADFHEMIYHSNIADPAVVADIERTKLEIEEERLASISGNETGDEIDASMKEFLDAFAEMITELNQKEEWEFEEVDIPSSLYMFDMFNPPVRSFEEHDEGDKFENEDEDDVFFDDFDDYGDYDDDCDCEECDDRTEEYEAPRNTLEINFDAVGSIRFLENNVLEMKYDESNITGEADTFVKFLIDCDNKDFVTVHRGGQSDMPDMWIDCEKGKRINSTVAHSNHFNSIYSISTKEIVNNITPRGGRFKLSYIRETNGMPIEIVTHIISASPIKKI